MKKNFLRLFFLLFMLMPLAAHAVGANGFYQYSVSLTRFISRETGKAPEAYLWVPENCQKVKAVMLAQQNMTEEQ